MPAESEYVHRIAKQEELARTEPESAPESSLRCKMHIVFLQIDDIIKMVYYRREHAPAGMCFPAFVFPD